MMSDFLRGLTGAFANYLQTERQKQRDAEDQEIDSRVQMLHQLTQRPDFNPEHFAMVFNDINQLQGAKGGRGKLKGGMAGMRGQHELPISQFIQMMQPHVPAGPAPLESTYQAGYVPTPTVTQQPIDRGPTSYGGLITPPGYDGQDVLESPTPLPPKGAGGGVINQNMLGAGHQMQDAAMTGNMKPVTGLKAPPQNGPFFTPEEMDQRQVNRESALAKGKYQAEYDAQHDAEYNYLRRFMSDEEIKQYLMDKVKKAGTTGKPSYSDVVGMTPDGKSIGYVVNSADGSAWQRDENGQPTIPFAVPEGTRRISIGPQTRTQFETNDAGNVSSLTYNPYIPDAPTAQVNPSGLKGRTSPAGPVVLQQGANGETNITRLGRQGGATSSVNIPTPPGTQPQPAHAPATASEKQDIQDTNTLAGQLRNIEAALAAHPQAMDTTGPLMGRFQNIRGSIPLVGSNPDYAALSVPVAGFYNAMLRILSGKQVTGSEATRLISQLPTMNDTREMFASKIANIEATIQDTIRLYQARKAALPPALMEYAQANGIQVAQQPGVLTPPPNRGTVPAPKQQAAPGTSGTTSGGFTWKVKQ